MGQVPPIYFKKKKKKKKEKKKKKKAACDVECLRIFCDVTSSGPSREREKNKNDQLPTQLGFYCKAKKKIHYI